MHLFFYIIFCLLDRSPVFSHLSASLQGLETIRIFQVQKTFTQIYHKLQDTHGGK